MQKATGTVTAMRLASIHLYPVKCFHRVDLDAAAVEQWALAGDRRWLVTDADGRMLTHREGPMLNQSQPSIVDGDLVLCTSGRPELLVPAKPGELVEVQVFRTPVMVSRAGDEADAWLSGALGREVHLVYLDDPTRRPVNPRYAGPDDRV